MNRREYGTSTEIQMEKNRIHPIWRGIGCVMLVIIPLMSFAAAIMLIDANSERGWFNNPRDLHRLPQPSGIFASLPAWLINEFYAKLLVAIFFSLVFFGIFVVFYSMVYRMGGGYRLSPVDAPPVKRKTKRSR